MITNQFKIKTQKHQVIQRHQLNWILMISGNVFHSSFLFNVYQFVVTVGINTPHCRRPESWKINASRSRGGYEARRCDEFWSFAFRGRVSRLRFEDTVEYFRMFEGRRSASLSGDVDGDEMLKLHFVPSCGSATSFMGFHVFAQVITPGEFLSAHLTNEALLTCMSFYVPLQLVGPSKTLAAKEPAASKRSLAGMPPQVRLQVRSFSVNLSTTGKVADVLSFRRLWFEVWSRFLIVCRRSCWRHSVGRWNRDFQAVRTSTSSALSRCQESSAKLFQLHVGLIEFHGKPRIAVPNGFLRPFVRLGQEGWWGEMIEMFLPQPCVFKVLPAVLGNGFLVDERWVWRRMMKRWRTFQCIFFRLLLEATWIVDVERRNFMAECGKTGMKKGGVQRSSAGKWKNRVINYSRLTSIALVKSRKTSGNGRKHPPTTPFLAIPYALSNPFWHSITHNVDSQTISLLRGRISRPVVGESFANEEH